MGHGLGTVEILLAFTQHLLCPLALAQVHADADHGVVGQADVGPVRGNAPSVLRGDVPLAPAGLERLHVSRHLGAIGRIGIDLAHEVALVGIGGGPAQHLFGVPVEREALESRIPHDQKDRNVVEEALKHLALMGQGLLRPLAPGDIAHNNQH